MRSVFITFILTVISFLCYAENETKALWNKANDLYTNNKYDSALVYYKQISNDYQSVALFYNLGNTYYKLNKVGNAVLNYERALKMAPNNQKVKDNLYLTQNRIANRIQENEPIFFIRWWLSITHASNATLWAILALIIFASTIIIHILKKLNFISFPIPTQATVLAIIIWAIFLTFSIYATSNKYYGREAVVMDNNASFKSQPDVAKSASLIPEGTKVYIIQQKSSWKEVILPDGRKGWMQANVLTKI